MYGWRARSGNISPTACMAILPYEFYRVAPEGVTFVTIHRVVCARGSPAESRPTINDAASAHSDGLKRSEKSTPIE
jgi:hypothetical protein